MSYDVAAFRARFPALRSGTAYFDGPGGSQVPSDVAALATVSGVGARKLGLYGESVLAILGGADVDEILSAAKESAGKEG